MTVPNVARPTVVIIEDDKSVRESLDGLFRSVGFKVKLFSSVEDFIAANQPSIPGCIVLDVRLPGKSGLEFYEEEVKAGNHRSVVFISGHADVPVSVRAMKAGAVEFLMKPVRDQDLLDAVRLAIDRDRVERESACEVARIQAAFESFTPREREIMALVVAGCQDKEIAGAVGESEATVRLNLGNIMQIMRAQSLAELLRVADKIEMQSPKS